MYIYISKTITPKPYSYISFIFCGSALIYLKLRENNIPAHLKLWIQCSIA